MLSSSTLLCRFGSIATLVWLIAAPAWAAQYTQAPGSVLAFGTSYDGQLVVGSFRQFQTQLTLDPNDLDHAKLIVTVDLASAQTGNAERDATLKGKDFFSTDQQATARYQADQFRAVGNDRFAVDGTLDLHGVRRRVPLTLTLTSGAKPILRAKGSLSRLDFGIGTGDWADTKLIPKTVAISAKVILVSSQTNP